MVHSWASSSHHVITAALSTLADVPTDVANGNSRQHIYAISKGSCVVPVIFLVPGYIWRDKRHATEETRQYRAAYLNLNWKPRSSGPAACLVCRARVFVIRVCWDLGFAIPRPSWLTKSCAPASYRHGRDEACTRPLLCGPGAKLPGSPSCGLSRYSH